MIEIPVWGLKLLTGYHKNRSKIGLNLNFKFKNVENRFLIGMTGHTDR
jgi:hypothetical protein